MNQIKETLNEPVLNLKSVAKSFVDEEVRKQTSAEYYQYHIKDFLEENYPEILQKIGSDYEEYEIYSEVESAYPEIYKIFSEWAYEKIQRESPTDGPFWLHMDFEKIIINKWLIHFSDSASSIYDDGFKYGVDIYDLNRLALSTHYGEKTRKRVEGYNFAYDVEHTNLERTATDRRGDPKYGKEAVMFIGSGVKFHHYGDQEDQVIFLGNSVREMVLISHMDYGDKKWGVVNKRNYSKPLYSSDDLDDITSWVIKNYTQYRKAMFESECVKFKDFYSDILEEAYASLVNPPSEIRIATGSEAEKIISGRKKSDLQTIQALQNTMQNFESIKRGAVWSQLVSERYPKRIGVSNVKTVLKLKGRNHERAIGKIENGIYYIYWIGTHEEYNKIY